MSMTKKVYDKYNYLLTRFPDTEWSGPGWYKIKLNEQGYPDTIKLMHFHPLDLGGHASTEWEAKDFAKIMRKTYEDNPSLKSCYIGLIHSHHNMGAFLSGTDKATIEDNSPKEGFYCSLVVSSKPGKELAFGFGYQDQYENIHVVEIDDINIPISHNVDPAWVKEADIIEKANKPVRPTYSGYSRYTNLNGWQIDDNSKQVNMFGLRNVKKKRKKKKRNKVSKGLLLETLRHSDYHTGAQMLEDAGYSSDDIDSYYNVNQEVK